MFSEISLERENRLVNGFLVDKNNPKLINYLVSVLGESSAQKVHQQITQENLMVLQKHQAVNEELLEELLEYGAVFNSQKILVDCNIEEITPLLNLGFKVLVQNDKALLEWG